MYLWSPQRSAQLMSKIPVAIFQFLWRFRLPSQHACTCTGHYCTPMQSSGFMSPSFPKLQANARHSSAVLLL